MANHILTVQHIATKAVILLSNCLGGIEKTPIARDGLPDCDPAELSSRTIIDSVEFDFCTQDLTLSLESFFDLLITGKIEQLAQAIRDEVDPGVTSLACQELPVLLNVESCHRMTDRQSGISLRFCRYYDVMRDMLPGKIEVQYRIRTLKQKAMTS